MCANVQCRNLHGGSRGWIVWKELAVYRVEPWEVVDVCKVGRHGDDVIEFHAGLCQDLANVRHSLPSLGFKTALDQLGSVRVASKVACDVQRVADQDAGTVGKPEIWVEVVPISV